MSRQPPRRSEHEADPRLGPVRRPKIDLQEWHEDMPVPAELRLTCEGCGKDLSGLERRHCPDCGRRFHLPIPEGLDLHCLECGYDLTGLRSRICPECGTGFDIRGLLLKRRLTRSHRFADRVPWYELRDWSIAVASAVFGMVMIIGSRIPFLFTICLITGILAAVRAYFSGSDPSRVALWAGVSWGIIGVLLLLLT